jgi:2-hydroxychromene-2-carboxylate isomerase
MHKLEFFFDCSSPWTYLAFNGIQPICAEAGVDIIWRPILVGGVFNAVNQDLYAARESMFSNERRMTYFMKDLIDWANYENIKIGWPSFHPVNSVKAMRGCFYAMEQNTLVPYAKALFEAYWGDEKDISNDDVLSDILTSLDMDPADFFTRIASQECKDMLRANTEELIERGGYGSPTMYIDGDDMYFGNDRLPLVKAALQS